MHSLQYEGRQPAWHADKESQKRTTQQDRSVVHDDVVYSDNTRFGHKSVELHCRVPGAKFGAVAHGRLYLSHFL
jgi:hypothetical protein